MLEELVAARYQRTGRHARLAAINLRLERMRHLFRIARRTGAVRRVGGLWPHVASFPALVHAAGNAPAALEGVKW